MRVITDIRSFLLLAALVVAPFVMAQDKVQDKVQGKAQPESLELIDEAEQPTITIRKPDAKQEITERREHGIVKEIKVQTGISTYYLYPNESPGNAFTDTNSTVVRPALWRIHEFDVTGQKPDENRGGADAGPDYSSDAPAPPTAPEPPASR